MANKGRSLVWNAIFAKNHIFNTFAKFMKSGRGESPVLLAKISLSCMKGSLIKDEYQLLKKLQSNIQYSLFK